MTKTKPAIVVLAAALAVWASKLSCDFVAPARSSAKPETAHGQRAERAAFASDSSQSRFAEAFLGSTACLALAGIAATSAHSRKGYRIVGLQAEGEAKEAAENTEGAKAESEDSPEADEEDVADDEDEAKEEGEEDENKPAKWKCLDCGSMNFAAATECEKCGASKPSPEEAKMVEERDQAKEEIAKVMDGFLRMQADLQNYRRQHDEAMGRAKDLGKLDALKKLLPFNDDIAEALVEPEGMDEKDKAIHDSYSLLFRKVGDVWAKDGVQTFDAAPGEKFDETSHKIAEEREVDGQEPGTILEVVKTGYKCDGKVVLPAEVVVVAPEKKAEEEEKEDKDESAESAAKETEETPEAADA